MQATRFALLTLLTLASGVLSMGIDYNEHIRGGPLPVKNNKKPHKGIDCRLVRCGNMYEPVCGKDGTTYLNYCQMVCIYNIKLKYEGECKPCKDCICNKIYKPVCGVNGKTYGNSCNLECANMSKDHDGPCDEKPVKDCICPLYYSPICGVDGKTYGNGCQIACACVKQAYEGECRPQCCEDKCGNIVDKVCGDDRKTYLNACLANCSNVSVHCRGPCRVGASNE